jgi:hypothetical protein
MQRRIALIAGVALLATSGHASAQTMNCGQAVTQLQSYAQQVNVVANQVYYQVIPMQCGYHQQCQIMMLGQLSAWYQEQAQLVTQWYIQINQQCNQRQGPALQNRAGREGAPELDRGRIADLQVDNEDRTVRIRIPDTPRGYR